MLYNLVRFFVFGICFLISFILVKKLSLSKKKAAFIFIVSYIVYAVIAITPFENAFVSFESPEEAFKYSKFGKIIMVTEAEESSMVAYQKNGKTYSSFVTYKKGGEYKLAQDWCVKKIHNKSTDSLKFSIYKIDGTSDYYLKVFGFASEKETLSDSNSKVFDLNYEIKNGNYYYYSLFAIDFSSEYKLYFNGETIVFD